MKDQYFGDERDYLKYSVALRVCRWMRLPNFSFIPMLTPNDGRGDGNKTGYDAVDDLGLFLKSAITDGRRQVCELRKYFTQRKGLPRYQPYRDDPCCEGENSQLDLNSRGTYFGSINDGYLHSALILIDPDNGLETPSTNPGQIKKYLKYSELEDTLRRASSDSLVELFQYFHAPKKSVFEDRAVTILEKCGSARGVAWIHVSGTCIYLIANSTTTFWSLDKFVAKSRRTLASRFDVSSISRSAAGVLASVAMTTEVDAAAQNTALPPNEGKEYLPTIEEIQQALPGVTGLRKPQEWPSIPQDGKSYRRCRLCGDPLVDGLGIDGHVTGGAHKYSYRSYRIWCERHGWRVTRDPADDPEPAGEE